MFENSCNNGLFFEMKRGAGGLGGSGPTRTIDRRALMSGQKSQPPLRRAAKIFWSFILVGLVSDFIHGGLIAPPPFEKKNRRPFRDYFIFD